MDPNAALDEIISLANRLVDSDNYPAARLAELMLNLDDWLRHGGFMPDAWEK